MTVMKDKDYKSSYNYILYIGISLWFIGLIIKLVTKHYEPENYNMPQNLVLKKVMSLAPMLMLVIPVFISPLIEDIS